VEKNGVKTERKAGAISVAARFVCYYLLIVVAGVLGYVGSWFAWCYITCPIYTFEEPKPFYGDKFYNPYQSLEPDRWRKCSFHLHSHSWLEPTHNVNTPEEFYAAYRKLKFDAIAISNHMAIDETYSESPLYIPAYEHGYSIKKIHQLALGAQKVVWYDCVILQNLNHKQYIIDLLKEHSRYVALNHPGIRKGYLPDDMKYLSGYDFVEVLNRHHIYEEEWDAALSHGHKVWLIASDDAHSVDNIGEVQRSATFVNVSDDNTSVLTGDAILERLAQGAAFGVRFPSSLATWEDKILAAENVSFPVAIRVQEDSLHVVWQERMTQIDFIGDTGNLLKTSIDTDTAFYSLRPEDTYVRVRITSPEGLVYYLNPVIRYEGEQPIRQSLHSIDASKTLLKRTVIVVIVSGILMGGYILYVRTKRKRGSSKI